MATMVGGYEQVKRRLRHVNTRWKNIQGSWNDMYKGPEAGRSQTCY